MNISIDDTSPNFVWSNGQDDWRSQAPNEVSLNSQYFLQTYHATQSKGADVAITFVGGAIQIYGSKGPNHGNYSVTFDNTIKFFAGFDETDQYQQLLFSRVFGSNLSEAHTVELRNEEDYWLDLDFVVLTVSTTADTSTSDIGFFTSTVTPGTSVPPSSTDSTSSDSDPNSSDSSSSAPSIFRTLTFALAGILGLAILVLLVWFFVFRKRRSRDGGGGSGRGRGMNNSSSQQEFRYAQKNGQMSGLDTSKTTGAGQGDRGFGRNNFAIGKEDYARSPTSAGGSTEMSPYTRHDGGNNNAFGGGGGGGGNGGTNPVVSGAARETLIALNNMGKRPGYRTLAGDAEGPGSRTSVAGASGGGGLGDGRETPASLRTMGSAGQVWLGATRPHDDRDRGGAERGGGGDRDSSGVRFKGRAGRESYNLLNKRSSSYGSDSNLSSRLAMQDRSRGGGGGLEHINDSKDEDPYTPISGIGLGMYAANIRSESDQQRMADLKRSASVASSGILDRLTSSPPPAVPELPPSATTSSLNSSRMDRMVPPPRNFSPTPTDGSTVYSHGGVHSGLGLATKVQHPYGRNNEMLVHSHSGSFNSTSGVSATTTAVNNGSLPLRPPPARAEERERERAMQRERERVEKEREANAERLYQREREMQRNAEARYSRAPPPEYVPTPTASQTSMVTVSAAGSGGGDLQRQGTRTGDIPIGLDGGAGGYGYESESQDSHSVAHAYVSTAQHVTVSPPAISQIPVSRIQQQQQQQSFSQQQQQQPQTQTQPLRPQHHVQRDGQMGSTGSSNLSLPHSTVTGTSAKRAVTPDRGRSYDPGRAVAVASGARSNTPTGMTGAGAPAWVSRASEESSKTWGLDGVQGADKMRTAPAPGLGRPIMDDRTRLAMGAAGGVHQTGQRVSRVPPPRE